MLLNIDQAAELMQVSEKTMLTWIRKEGLRACKVNDQYRLNRVDLLEWATDHGKKLPPSFFSGTDTLKESLPDLSEALEAGGINRGIAGDDTPSALKNVVDKLRLPPQVDREFMLQVLLAREALGTTAIGDGIAIPHVRNPILLNIAAPAINLCFLQKPINFGAIDGKPVDILFTLISPTVKIHLHMLAKLAYALRDERFKGILRCNPTDVQIMEVVRRIESEIPEQRS